jgi:tRNA-Thr(GGU) m(6)t(6)A37 methyltransferase TsaA
MVSFAPIGFIRSCFKEKFGIPRQAGLVPEASARIEICPPYNREEAFRELSAFSHIWIIFQFHEIKKDGWAATVRPPRLGGNKRIGVFASRSGFRPNPIGLSVVNLEKISYEAGQLHLHVGGGDFLDGTPVLDIKPYLPYADSHPGAIGGFAASPPPACLEVGFSKAAAATCGQLSSRLPRLKALITHMLQCDPRPAYYHEKAGKKRFGTRIYDLDIKWECGDHSVIVYAIDTGINGSQPF